MSDILRRLFTETWPAKAAKSAFEALMTPGQVASGQLATQPSVPGMWSDEDESRSQLTQQGIGNRATDLAGLVMGGSYAAAPAMKNASGMGIRAYHGSPHDFDRFDLSKIGTGEGAQSYGHGLYFAENEAVAKAYRDQLAGSSKGRMYEVDIKANPENLLDWDKPLAGQAIATRVANAVRPELRGRFSEEVADGLKGYESLSYLPKIVYSVRNERGQFMPVEAKSFAEATAMAGGDSSAVRFYTHKDKALTSNTLLDAGIPGIKYLDQGSRNAGEGSRNYVVFDDKLVDILRKYGITGTAGPLAALMMGGESQAQPTAP